MGSVEMPREASSDVSSVSYQSTNGFYTKRCSKIIDLHGRSVIATTAIRWRDPGRPEDPSEAYRNALHAFIERRKNPNDPSFIVAPSSPDKVRLDLLIKKNYENDKTKNNHRTGGTLPGVPYAPAPDIFEIGWVAGTEDRYMELIYAEWHNTRVSLRRHTHPDCKGAVRADLEVLSEIRHPNVILLMGTTQTDDYGLVAIFEPVDCTLFNYIHEQGERISVQGVAKCAGNLAAALKHAHMRGYIHSAISPHCVLLASTGIVKLAGWELATNINGPKVFREYEDRLRSEIYRWQAPELLSGHEASAAADIYSLTLLIWEMCTMNVPWNNLNKAEVERQYTHYRRGVIIDLYNFPPLLNNLLEAGLQLDVTKRTLDMPKMSRYLQRLEMQHEEDEPIFIEQMTNNNKPGTPPVCKSPVVTKCTAAETPKRYTRETVPLQTSADSQLTPEDVTKTTNILDQVLKATSIHNANLITKNMRTNDISKNRDLRPRRASYTSRADNSTDEETFSDPRVNIKKLKETLASKRETFFYGNESLHGSAAERRESLKTRILTQIRSKDYEPHKPASHKTSLEPKLNKSPGQYGTYTKSTQVKTQKPYSYVPTPIRGAVIQPQVLNPDSKSFFETSLWRKEKLICMSKMRRSNPEQYRSVNLAAEDAKGQSQSNETYTIQNSTEDSRNGNAFTATDSSPGENSTMPRSKSLQALKDALDRATDIVKSANTSSTTPLPPSSRSHNSSPFNSPKSFGDAAENSEANESVFEELYRLNEKAEDEIKIIERSEESGDTFVLDGKKTSDEDESTNEKVNDDEKNCSTESAPGDKPEAVRAEPTVEAPKEQDPEENREPEVVLQESACAGEQLGGSGPLAVSMNSRLTPDEETETSFTLFVFGEKGREKGCFSCAKGNLARRRSLPAHLGQLRSLSSTSLGKIPIRRIDLPDNTVEDLYIDDEFGDSLAVNMVLLNEDDPADDEDFLPDLLELSGTHEYS